MTSKSGRARKTAPRSGGNRFSVTLDVVPRHLLGPQFRRGERIVVDAVLLQRLEDAEAVSDVQPAD